MSREMKNSGVPWIGDIPNYWSAVRIKDLADNSKNDSFTDGDWIESQYITDNGIRYYTSGNVGDGAFKPQGNGYISEETFAALKCKYAYPGDLVIARLNAPFGRSCILPSESDKYVLAVDIAILRTAYCKEYLNYAMQCQRYHHAVEEQASGTAMQRISRSNLGKIKLPIPPMAEQKSIVHYLDSHCSTIDSAISKHQQIIEKLEEYRKAVITQAVTKGLNPNVEMKDSGVPWIGKIPVHWEKMRIKQAGVKTGSGTTPKSALSEYYDGNVSWIQSGDLYGVSSIEETKRSVTETALKQYSVLKVYKHPFVVIAMYGASIGNVAISNIDACVNQACCVIMPNHSNNIAFVKYWLELCKEDFIQQSVGGGQPNISQEKILEQVYVKPPIAEQNDIASYLDSKCSGIANMIDQHNQLISKLQEYKQSLIYNAVTGKIDCTTEASI